MRNLFVEHKHIHVNRVHDFCLKIKHLLGENKFNNNTQILKISVSSVICCTCKKYLAEKRIPTDFAKLNSLEANQVHSELTGLNTMKKTTFEQNLNIVFTMIILPGGQSMLREEWYLMCL